MDPEYPDLISPDELSGYPGAPFDEEIIKDACQSVRAEAGWHIAPTWSDVVLVDSDGGSLLTLPTLKLVSIESVMDVSDPDRSRPITDWRKTKSGMLYRRAGWPEGFEAVEVTMTHGYEVCPRDLRSVIAERAQFAAVNATVGQESAGSVSISYRNEHSQGVMPSDRRIRRYRL